MSPYGSDGVDVTLIRWMLSLTPAERLAVLQDFTDFVWEVRKANARLLPLPSAVDASFDRVLP
jgi:hypothetical protein